MDSLGTLKVSPRCCVFKAITSAWIQPFSWASATSPKVPTRRSSHSDTYFSDKNPRAQTMTDPLSITVGILAILGTCSAGAKSLRSIYVLPQEYTRLEVELDHLYDITKFVDGLVTKHQLTGNALIKNLTLARSKLEEVQHFMHNSLHHSRLSPLKRRTLVRHKHRLASFAKDIETAKAHIVDSILLSNL